MHFNERFNARMSQSPRDVGLDVSVGDKGAMLCFFEHFWVFRQDFKYGRGTRSESLPREQEVQISRSEK